MVTSLVSVSCIFSDKAQWSIDQPKDALDVWHAPITIALSNATPAAALHITESTVLVQTGKKVKLSFGKRPDPFNNDFPHPGTISFSASNIAPCDVIKILAEMQGCRAVFKKRSATLTPALHGDGTVTIELVGSCVDEASHDRIPRFTFFGRSHAVDTDMAGRYTTRLEVDGYTDTFYITPATCFHEMHPDERVLELTVSAPDYASERLMIPLRPDCLTYTNNIQLKQNPVQRSSLPNVNTRR